MHVPGDEVHTPLFEAGPASLLDIGGSLGKFIGRELASPVGLHSFLNLTVCTYGNAEREMNNIDGDQEEVRWTYRCEGNREHWREPWRADGGKGKGWWSRMEGGWREGEGSARVFEEF